MKVYISSSNSEGVSSIYKDLACDVATILARNDFKLIYGAEDTGMMGKTLLTYKFEGKKVKGIVDILKSDYAKTLELNALDITLNEFERLEKSYDQSDLIIILPGGINTLSDFFSMLEEKYIKIDDKKIVLFNYNHFYTPLLNYITKLHEDRFIKEDVLKKFDIIKDTKTFEEYIIKIKQELE